MSSPWQSRTKYFPSPRTQQRPKTSPNNTTTNAQTTIAFDQIARLLPLVQSMQPPSSLPSSSSSSPPSSHPKPPGGLPSSPFYKSSRLSSHDAYTQPPSSSSSSPSSHHRHDNSHSSSSSASSSPVKREIRSSLASRTETSKEPSESSQLRDVYHHDIHDRPYRPSRDRDRDRERDRERDYEREHRTRRHHHHHRRHQQDRNDLSKDTVVDIHEVVDVPLDSKETYIQPRLDSFSIPRKRALEEPEQSGASLPPPPPPYLSSSSSSSSSSSTTTTATTISSSLSSSTTRSCSPPPSSSSVQSPSPGAPLSANSTMAASSSSCSSPPPPLSHTRLPPPPLPARKNVALRSPPPLLPPKLTPLSIPQRPNARPGPLITVETPSVPSIAIENVVLDKQEQAGCWISFDRILLYSLPFLCFGFAILISFLLSSSTSFSNPHLVSAGISGGVSGALCILAFMVSYHLYRSYSIFSGRRVMMVFIGSLLMIGGSGALSYGFHTWYTVYTNSAHIIQNASYYSLVSQPATGYNLDTSQISIDWNHVYIQHRVNSLETLYIVPLQSIPAPTKANFNVWLLSKFNTPASSTSEAFQGFLNGAGVTTIAPGTCDECDFAVNSALSDLWTSGTMASQLDASQTRMVWLRAYGSDDEPARTVGFAALIACAVVTGVWTIFLLWGVGLNSKVDE